jgi:CheY-like chemotaxis protein
MSVLVVDDDQQLVAALTELLAELQLDSTAAGDGATALELLRGGLRPSVVLMDLVMPNTGGIELFAEMLADPDLRGIPVITMSGLKVDMRMPSRAHLEKPFGLNELLEALRSATGLRITPRHPEPRSSPTSR